MHLIVCVSDETPLLIVSDLATKTTPVTLFKIGDKVRVKPSVHTPKHDWGNVTVKSVGVLQCRVFVMDTNCAIWNVNMCSTNIKYKYKLFLFSAIKDDGNLIVNFPGHEDWKGILSEIELVTVDNEFGKYRKHDIEVADTLQTSMCIFYCLSYQ